MTVENISFFKYFFIFLEFFSNASLSPKKRLIARSSKDSFPNAKYFSFCEKETFSGIFLILETRNKNKITLKKMKKMTDNRPLSPHLSIHKRVLTAVFSIFHRISGIGLSVGALLISIWFFLISFGPEFYIYFETLSKSILFKLVLMIWTVGIFYHLFNGCRKLYWSFGIGMELSQVYKSGYAVICLTLISSLVVWYFA